MNSEAEKKLEEIGNDIISYIREFEERALGIPEHDTESWIKRGHVISEMLDGYLKILSKHREFRRAYDDQVNAATLNKMDHTLEKAGSLFPELISTIITGIEENQEAT